MISSCKDAALEYATRGWPVVALYTNTDEGCTCGDTNCKSPGKHPRPDINSKGVNDATADLKKIAEWPEDINVGIALGHKDLMAFDVDVSKIAAMLLEPRVGLSDETGTVVTGRPGCHVYFECTGDVSTVHVKASGQRIGEIRGLGSYVVAPPSISASGRPYRWIGTASLIPGTLRTVGDAFGYVSEILKSIGVEVDPVGPSVSPDMEGFPEAIVPLQLPDQLEKHHALLNEKILLRGGIGKASVGGRSNGIFSLAVKIGGVAAEAGVALSRVALAGILKRADQVYFDKYEGEMRSGVRSQKSADYEYYRIACKVLSNGDLAPRSGGLNAEVEITEPAAESSEADAEDESTATIHTSHYKWDEVDGVLRHVQIVKSGEKFTEVSNFKPEMVAEVTVDRDEKDAEILWKVRFTLARGRTVEANLEEADRSGTSSMEKAMSKKFPSDFMVFPYAYVHIKPALHQFREKMERYTTRAVTGWFEVGDERYYLLPGALGAVGKSGMNAAYRLNRKDLPEKEAILNSAFENYGVGIRPAASQEVGPAWDAFEMLATCGTISVTFPVILQVLAGPLYSIGSSNVPPLMHVFGRTGVLKTSYCLAALSLLGTFNKETAPPMSWNATPGGVQGTLNAAKDLTILVDDFKVTQQKEGGALTSLINNYADKSTRRRLTSKGELQETKSPRGLLLSNGEDRWEKEASTVARTIIIDVGDDDIDEDRLTAAQEYVKEGVLQLFGGSFIAWVASQDELFETSMFEDDRSRIHRLLLKRYKEEGMHRRLLASISTLIAVSNVLLRFIEEAYPNEKSKVKVWVREMTTSFLATVRERAEEVRSLAPSKLLCSYIADCMSAGSAVLRPALGVDEDHFIYPDNPRGEVVGWWDEKDGKRYALLNYNTTFAWYQREMGRRRENISFSWNSFTQEMRTAYGAILGGQWVVKDNKGSTKGTVQVLRIPIDTLERYTSAE